MDNRSTLIIDVEDRVSPALAKIDNSLSKTTKNAEGLSRATKFNLQNESATLSNSNRTRFATASLPNKKEFDKLAAAANAEENALYGKADKKRGLGGRGLSNFGKASGMGGGGMGRFAGLARLGAAGPVGAIAAVGAVAIATGKHLVDVSKEIQNNNQVIEQSFGLAGTAAQKLGSQATALSRTFGDDYSSTVGAANTLTREFGLSGEAAFALIEKGYASGANKGGEMLAQISEFSDEMKALGLSAKQQIALLSQTEKVGGAENLIGIFEGVQEQLSNLGTANKKSLNSVLGDGFIDGLISQMKKGEISTAEATQKISQSLLSAKVPAAQFKETLGLVFGEAGNEMGLAMVENLAALNLNLDEVVGKNAEFSSQLSEQLEWEKAIAAEQQQFAPTWAKIGDATNKAMNYLELGFYKAVNFASDLTSSLYQANESVYSMVGNFFNRDWEGLSRNFSDLYESITGEKAAAQASLNEAVQSQITLYQDKVKRGEDVSAMENRFMNAANSGVGQLAQKISGISAQEYLAGLRGEKTKTDSPDKTSSTLTAPKSNAAKTKSTSNPQLQESQRAVISGGKETRNVTVTINNLVGEVKVSLNKDGSTNTNEIVTEISNLLLSSIQNAEMMSS